MVGAHKGCVYIKAFDVLTIVASSFRSTIRQLYSRSVLAKLIFCTQWMRTIFCRQSRR
jgi:hypothetical protein